jgi:hypothetical protein
VVLDRPATALVPEGEHAARTAGVVRHCSHHPGRSSNTTGISAGAINVRSGARREFPECSGRAGEAWLRRRKRSIESMPDALRNVIRWGWRLVTGGMGSQTEPSRACDTLIALQFLTRVRGKYGRAPISGDR